LAPTSVVPEPPELLHAVDYRCNEDRDALPPHHDPQCSISTPLLRFFCEGLGSLREIRRRADREGAPSPWSFSAEGPRDTGTRPQVELTVELFQDQAETYTVGRNFGHLGLRGRRHLRACQSLVDLGYTISRPPRDGRMAFVRSPDQVSVELLQRGAALPPREP
jgi:lactoylglutathione lyase